MIDLVECPNSRILVVIPARSGSKRLPKKNTYPLLGKPLIQYTFDFVRQIDPCISIVLSTDDDGVIEIVKSYQNIKLIKRPPSLALDTTKTEEVLFHALQSIDSKSAPLIDWIITLQPTSPMRTHDTFDKCISIMNQCNEDIDCILTLTETREDFWQHNEDGEYERLMPNQPRRQQERQPLFVENGVIYCTRVAALYETGSVLGSAQKGVVTNQIEGIDINELSDIHYAEFILRNKK